MWKGLYDDGEASIGRERFNYGIKIREGIQQRLVEKKKEAIQM